MFLGCVLGLDRAVYDAIRACVGSLACSARERACLLSVERIEGASTGGGNGTSCAWRGVGFSQSDVLICHRLGFDFAAFRAFCAAGAIFYVFQAKNLKS